uniref:SCP2 domain-containing protein n=1 Tax=Cyprinus carpio TaxID=7962 RepID=A0A8C1VT39_CYPCA
MWKEANRIHIQCKVRKRSLSQHAPGHNSLGAGRDDAVRSQTGGLQSDLVFAEIGRRIRDAGQELVKKVNAVFGWEISRDGRTVREWTMDLKTGGGSLRSGASKADVIFTVSDEDFMEVVKGKLNPQKAFFSGKLKVRGNIMLSQKLEAVLKDYAKL